MITLEYIVNTSVQEHRRTLARRSMEYLEELGIMTTRTQLDLSAIMHNSREMNRKVADSIYDRLPEELKELLKVDGKAQVFYTPTLHKSISLGTYRVLVGHENNGVAFIGHFDSNEINWVLLFGPKFEDDDKIKHVVQLLQGIGTEYVQPSYDANQSGS